MDEYAREIYQKTGLGERVPFDHFKSAYFRYLQGKKNGEFSQPLITFINFNYHNGTKRLFLTDVSGSGASIVFESFVGHGVNSDDGGNSVTFGNVPESKKSSLGAFKVAESYQGKYGYSLRVDGLSPGINNNARSRAIVFHASYYSTLRVIERNGRMGNSWGCFTVPFSYRDSLFGAIKDGTLLYAFHDDLQPEQTSGEGLSEVAMADNAPSNASINQGEPLPSLEDDPNYSSAPPSLASQGQAGMNECPTPGQGVDGEGTLNPVPDDVPERFDEENPQVPMNPNAPYHGSDDFVRCQGYADTKYDNLVSQTQSGGNVGSHFKSSWVDAENKTGTCENQYAEAALRYGTDHSGRIEECVGMTGMIDPRAFELEDPNAHFSTSSADGKITCDYKGVTSSIDYFACEDNLRKPHDEEILKQKQMREAQAEDFKEQGTKLEEELKNSGPNIQGASALMAGDLNSAAKGIAGEREEFQKARIQRMTAGLQAMPTHSSLLQRCQKYYSQQSLTSIDDFKAFSRTIPDIEIAIPNIKDPCPGVLNRMNNKFLVNKKAKNQAIKVIEELGGKVSTLQDQQSELGKRRRVNSAMSLNGSGSGNFGDDDPLKTYKKIDGDEASDRLDRQMGDVNVNFNSSTGNRRPAAFGATNFQGRARDQIYNEKSFKMNDYLSQLNSNSHMFFKSAAKDSPEKVLSFMKGHGLSLEDIEFAYRAGKITKERRDFLLQKLRGRVGVPKVARKVSFPTLGSAKRGQSEFQIEKDKEKSLFQIISHRYFKKIHLFSED